VELASVGPSSAFGEHRDRDQQCHRASEGAAVGDDGVRYGRAAGVDSVRRWRLLVGSCVIAGGYGDAVGQDGHEMIPPWPAVRHRIRCLAAQWRLNDDDVDRDVFARHSIGRSPFGPREITLLARLPRPAWDPRHDEVAHMDYRICDLCRLGMVLKIRTAEEWKRRRYASWMIERSRRFAPDYTWVTSRQLTGSEEFWGRVKARNSGQYRQRLYCKHVHASLRRPSSRHWRAVGEP
jgi:hypothetical protein